MSSSEPHGGHPPLPLEGSAADGVDATAFPVLLVDDEPQALAALLEQIGPGFTIATATSASEAMALLATQEFALLVTDQRMRDVSGVELARRVARTSPDTIRIVLSGLPDDPELNQALAQNELYHCIVKPPRMMELRLLLRRAIETYALARRNHVLVRELQDRNEALERVVEERTSQIREWAERQRKLAISDGLTGLYNHRHFQERWRREVKRAQRYGQSVSLMIIDVDKFKNYNDTMGHPQGDQLLRNLSLLLRRSVRDVDLVARYGGEEFVAMLPETRKDDAIILAERVRSLVAQHPFEHRDVQPSGRITVSVGVASFPADGSGPSEVLFRADKALYRAKEGGRDRVVVASGDDSVEARIDDDGDLALIVEEDGDTRVAALSATDVPVAGAIDTMRLRLKHEQTEATVDDPRPRPPEGPKALMLDDGGSYMDSLDEIVVEVDDYFDPTRTEDDIADWMKGSGSN